MRPTSRLCAAVLLVGCSVRRAGDASPAEGEPGEVTAVGRPSGADHLSQGHDRESADPTWTPRLYTDEEALALKAKLLYLDLPATTDQVLEQLGVDRTRLGVILGRHGGVSQVMSEAIRLSKGWRLVLRLEATPGMPPRELIDEGRVKLREALRERGVAVDETRLEAEPKPSFLFPRWVVTKVKIEERPSPRAGVGKASNPGMERTRNVAP